MPLDVFDEIDFIPKLNLELMSQTKKGWNFRCPFCGDSKKSKFKKRGWLLRDRKYGRERLIYHCFNCNLPNMEFRNFLKDVSPHLFDEYKEKERDEDLKNLKQGNLIRKKDKAGPNRIDLQAERAMKLFTLNPRSFKPARQYPQVVAYCERRKFPSEVIDNLLYCPLKNSKIPWREMIIFPLKKGAKVYGFQGRSIKGKRFHNFMPNDHFKVHGIFDVSLVERVYCFESIIDSYAVPNSIAMLGASIPEKAMKKLKDVVFVFDNDKTGLERALKYVVDGNKVFLWPDKYAEKDFNELIVNRGLIPSMAKKFIDKYTSSGLAAEVKLKIKLSNK